MEATYKNYFGTLLLVPLSTFTVTLLVLNCLTLRIYWFILKNLFGIRPDRVESKHSMISDDNVPYQHYTFPCIIRSFADTFAAALLALLSLVLFEAQILATDTVLVNQMCPRYVADCFGRNDDGKLYGPFVCRPGDYANFPVTSPSLKCFGWIYGEMNLQDMFFFIGAYVLLIIIVCLIVPLVYYMAFYKKQIWWISLVCVVIPLTPIVFFTFYFVWSAPIVMVQTYVIVFFILFIVAALMGWIWTVILSCKHRSI